MYVVEITTDKTFEALTTEDSLDQNHIQVGFNVLTCIFPPFQTNSWHFNHLTIKFFSEIMQLLGEAFEIIFSVTF